MPFLAPSYVFWPNSTKLIKGINNYFNLNFLSLFHVYFSTKTLYSLNLFHYFFIKKMITILIENSSMKAIT
jgi:hypothetical protein